MVGDQVERLEDDADNAAAEISQLVFGEIVKSVFRMNISPLSSSLSNPPAPSAMSICPSPRGQRCRRLLALADCQIDTFQNMNGCRGTSQGEIGLPEFYDVFVTRRAIPI